MNDADIKALFACGRKGSLDALMALTGCVMRDPSNVVLARALVDVMHPALVADEMDRLQRAVLLAWHECIRVVVLREDPATIRASYSDVFS